MSLSPSQFNELPLHDATLLSVAYEWGEKKCRLELRAYDSRQSRIVSCLLEFCDVTNIVIPHTNPWGPSVSINSCSYTSGVYEIEMQSGDTIAVHAETCNFTAL